MMLLLLVYYSPLEMHFRGGGSWRGRAWLGGVRQYKTSNITSKPVNRGKPLSLSAAAAFSFPSQAERWAAAAAAAARVASQNCEQAQIRRGGASLDAFLPTALQFRKILLCCLERSACQGQVNGPPEEASWCQKSKARFCCRLYGRWWCLIHTTKTGKHQTNQALS